MDGKQTGRHRQRDREVHVQCQVHMCRSTGPPVRTYLCLPYLLPMPRTAVEDNVILRGREKERYMYVCVCGGGGGGGRGEGGSIKGALSN